jgi:small subunit ribosomal protein S16
MLVRLRLTKTGKKNTSSFRIVATQLRTKRDGMAIEYLGFYDPRSNPKKIELDEVRIKDWLSKGAQPSPTVKYLLIKKGILKADKEKQVFHKKPGIKKQKRAAAAEAKKPAEAKPEPKAE